MTTKQEISRWFDEGVDEGADYMFVVCDTFDYEDYPIYCSTKEFDKQHKQHNNNNMQRIMEIYDLKADKEEQMKERRTFRRPGDLPKSGLKIPMPKCKEPATQIDVLINAARQLTNKLDEITQSEEYQGVFTLAFAHGIKYTGPQYDKDLQALKDALDLLDVEGIKQQYQDQLREKVNDLIITWGTLLDTEGIGKVIKKLSQTLLEKRCAEEE